MCDTLGTLRGGRVLFGKNSDRSPNEPQVLEFIPAAVHEEKLLNATYISVPQVRKTHAVLISRPTWMWGAEMGVNDCGVCIGNEAVFTLARYGRTGLTGMDMLRMALERSSSAKEAVGTVTALLEKHGQGGNCGYDHEFLYDNSFLIMDRDSLYVLETCGKKWVCRRAEADTISNRLCIGSDGDEYSGGRAYDFRRRHTERVYTLGSGSAQRRQQTQNRIGGAEDVSDIISALRTHDKGVVNPFAQGSVSSTCMHFGGIVGDHTTQSMAVELRDDKTVVWATGSSLPCVSLFKPWQFGAEPSAPVFGAGSPAAEEYWQTHEKFRRGLIGKTVPGEYYEERDELERRWLELAREGDITELTPRCAEEERGFFEKWSGYAFGQAKCSVAFKKRWGAL